MGSPTSLRTPLKEIAIAVMGPSGSGKTTFINLLSGSNFNDGRGIQGYHREVRVGSPFELDGHLVTLIETPSFDNGKRSDAKVLNNIASYLSTMYEQGGRLTGIIYMQKISNLTMDIAASRNLEMFKSLCGPNANQNVIVVTSAWDTVEGNVGQDHEREFMRNETHFRTVMESGGKMMRHNASVASGEVIIRQFLRKPPLALRIQDELCTRRLDITETAAGSRLISDILEESNTHKSKLRWLEMEITTAKLANDAETENDIRKECSWLQAKVERLENEMAEMAVAYGRMNDISKGQTHVISRIPPKSRTPGHLLGLDGHGKGHQDKHFARSGYHL
ncbi:hypothetical protein BD410DRAFT_827362 [Rickenella mellea]|uniref:G domain-containing protein n=1 Tax=Rickenella mellea TaxID=50990 RepID=A0A4Y7QAK1_9AGAM|nr:hypothetical protein BD410DRAFT_827362 [Rickenella mellea]